MAIPLIDPIPVIPVRGAAVSASAYREAVDGVTGPNGLPRAITQANTSFQAANAALAGIDASVGTAAGSAQLAQDIYEQFQAQNLPALNGTSVSPVLIGLGAKAFTASTGKIWWTGLNVVARDAANAGNFIVGTVTAYNPATGALAINARNSSGSGTIANWLISPGGPRDLTAQRATYEAIGAAIPTTSGTAWTWTNIPAVYSDLRFEFVDVNMASSAGLQAEYSTNNGTSWSTPALVATSVTGPFYGAVKVDQYRGARPTIVGVFGTAPRSLLALGPINAVRISFAGGGAGTGGSIQLYGI